MSQLSKRVSSSACWPSSGRPSATMLAVAMARWTPNYIKSDPAGVWCSPYWFYGCYVVGDPQYANQFELSGGLSFRF